MAIVRDLVPVSRWRIRDIRSAVVITDRPLYNVSGCLYAWMFTTLRARSVRRQIYNVSIPNRRNFKPLPLQASEEASTQPMLKP